MFRSNTYTEGSFYTLVPLSRQAVVPGQSLAVDLQACWETPAFQKNVLSGGMASIMAFYTPYRLCWSGWINFISDPESTFTVPKSTVAMPQVFENYVTAGNTFGRRAYKLIYNQYFGSNQFPGNLLYADPFDDADVTIKRIRTTDQFLGRIMPDSAVSDQIFEAPVGGTPTVASIDLNEFRQSMKNARSDRRADLTGDKYVDAMRRMGVQLDWKIQNAPEFLGASTIDFDSKETRATYTGANPPPEGAAATGRKYSRFNEKQSLRTSRKFFAEHGIVMTVLAVRPHVIPFNTQGPQECYVDARDEFYLGDNQTGVNEVNAVRVGATGGENYFQSRFSWLRSGSNLHGLQSSTPWYAQVVGADLSALVWPTVPVAQDDVLQNDFAVYTRYKSDGPTPVKSVTF